MKTAFLRVLEVVDKAAALRETIHNSDGLGAARRFDVAPKSFSVIPSSPFAYWASEIVLDSFRRHPAFESEGRHAATGAQTRDNMRFIRAAWEVSPTTIALVDETAELPNAWVPLAKGGSYGRFYSDVHLLVQWARNGRELKTATSAWRAAKGWGDYWTAAINSSDYYGQPALTWPLRTNGLSFRAMPAGCIFGHKGPAAFVNDGTDELLALASIANSSMFGVLVSVQLARTQLAQSYEVGLVQNTPIPHLEEAERRSLARCGHRAWSQNWWLDTCIETSHAFVLPALLQADGPTLRARTTAWKDHVLRGNAELTAIQTEIDERCFRVYGITEADLGAVAESVGEGDSASVPGDAEEVATGEDDDEDDVDFAVGAEASALAAQLVSWAVGVAFGRFDVRLATGGRVLPSEPEPFDPLPACSPGMLTGENGLPVSGAPAGYSLAFPQSGILVDDPGDPRDLTSAVRAVFETVFGSSADVFWQEAAALLDPRGHDLRAWLRSGFFEYHLKLYSKSRRKAPILWQLGTSSGRYSVWLYAHRLTADSLFELQRNVVALKLTYEERLLADLVQNAGDSPSARERKEIAEQEAFVEELRVLLDDVKQVAPLWKPTLDDGVVLVMAPLWRLVRHKSWQKELKARWTELAAGKYDWAHLAMRLWPERVVPTCAADRSLAIAHGLDDVFWIEDNDGKWQPREAPTAPVEALVRERTSDAVKAALVGLLDAPDVAAPRRRGHRHAEAPA